MEQLQTWFCAAVLAFIALLPDIFVKVLAVWPKQDSTLEMELYHMLFQGWMFYISKTTCRIFPFMKKLFRQKL